MILTDIDIRDRVFNSINYIKVYEMDKFKSETVPLIEPFNEDQLEAASYDVKITNKITRFKNEFRKIKLQNQKNIDTCYETIDITNGYDLRPGEYILVKLRETINMPNDLTAHIRPRTSLNKIGILLSAQNINPSYCGALSLGVYNASPYVIEIKPGLAIGQVIFEKLAGRPSQKRLYINKSSAKYQNEKDFVGSKIYDDLNSNEKEIIDIAIEKFIGDLKSNNDIRCKKNNLLLNKKTNREKILKYYKKIISDSNGDK